VHMNDHVAARVAKQVNQDYGEEVVTAQQVKDIHAGNPSPNEPDEAIQSRVLQECEEYGF
jgi:hypothetical protein